MTGRNLTCNYQAVAGYTGLWTTKKTYSLFRGRIVNFEITVKTIALAGFEYFGTAVDHFKIDNNWLTDQVLLLFWIEAAGDLLR